MKNLGNLLYGVDDKPPLWINIFLGFQHVCIITISFIFPVLVVQESNGTSMDAARMLSISMIAGAVGTIIQSLKRKSLGSGFLCPPVCGPSYLAPSIQAAAAGGLPLVFGMTLVASFFEAIFSKFIKYLRFFFPVEVTGLIVAMVGITVTKYAMVRFFGLHNDSVVSGNEIFIAFATLSVMIGLNVWSKGKLKLFCIILGMLFGYLMTFFIGGFQPHDFEQLRKLPVFSTYFLAHPGFSFSWYMLLPFIIAMLCSSLKSIGDIVTCQKINDEDWKRPDMDNVGGGIFADAAGAMTAGLLGGYGQSTSSTNIGLSIATGVTSRVIAWSIAAILILMAFCPRIAGIFYIMPPPVMGAVLLFALAFMVVAGFQIIMSRMMDGRKTFVVGISLIVGIGADVVPEAYHWVHPSLSPIFSSSLSTATVCAVVLNLIFRIGISQKASLALPCSLKSSTLFKDFIEEQGRIWGARQEVISKVFTSINEFIEFAVDENLYDEEALCEVRYEELYIDIKLSYSGDIFKIPDKRPSAESLSVDIERFKELRTYIMANLADKSFIEKKGDVSVINLHFEQ